MGFGVYISRENEGWIKIDLPEECRQYSYDKLVSCIDRFVDRDRCKGLLITENPSPF